MKVINNLEKLGFTRLEAQIYLVLLKSKPMSAYQIAKKIDMSRPAIYNCLEHMFDKGMVDQIPNDTALYIAQNPEVLFNKMKSETAKNLHEAELALREYELQKYDEMNLNFCGYQTMIQKAKKILHESEEEVYINSDFSIDFLEDEIKDLKERGVKVIVFSFYDICTDPSKIEYYSHYRPLDVNHNASRLMIAVDKKMALIADGSGSEGVWKGTISNNTLLIKILSEHIHNDIYLLKLRNKYGREIYEEFLFVHTDFEKRTRAEEKKQN